MSPPTNPDVPRHRDAVLQLLGLFQSYDDVPEDDERAQREIDAEIKTECARLAQLPDGVIQLANLAMANLP